ncbi:MAG: hypothetical protein ACLS4Z_02585 [Christensenellaceae bacterium]
MVTTAIKRNGELITLNRYDLPRLHREITVSGTKGYYSRTKAVILDSIN